MTQQPNRGEIVIYRTADNQVQLDVQMYDYNIWLNRQQLAVLFDRDYKTISKHINNALKEELADSVVVAKFATTIKSIITDSGNTKLFPKRKQL